MMPVLVMQPQEQVGMNWHDRGNLSFQDSADRTEADACRVWSKEFLFAEALAAEAETPIL